METKRNETKRYETIRYDTIRENASGLTKNKQGRKIILSTARLLFLYDRYGATLFWGGSGNGEKMSSNCPFLHRKGKDGRKSNDFY